LQLESEPPFFFATFRSRALIYHSANGITTLYVMGAIERDNGWGEVDPESSDPAIKSAVDLAVANGLLPSSGIPKTYGSAVTAVAASSSGQFVGTSS
jgi:hypothetical protein